MRSCRCSAEVSTKPFFKERVMAKETEPVVPTERVTLVKFEKNRVSVKYEVRNGAIWEKRSFQNCTDTPSEEFAAAFKRLNQPALKIGHVAEKRWQVETVVTEIHVDHEKSGRIAFELVLAHEVEKGVALLYLPSRQEKLSESERGAEYASNELVADVKAICAEALLYVRGERVQTEMFAEAEEGEPEEQVTKPALAATKKSDKKPAAKKAKSGPRRR